MVAVLPIVEGERLIWVVESVDFNTTNWQRLNETSILNCHRVGGVLAMMQLAQQSEESLEGWCSCCLEFGVKRPVRIAIENGEGIVWVSQSEGGGRCELD